MAYRCTDSHVTTKFFLDRWSQDGARCVTKFSVSYGAPLARLPRAEIKLSYRIGQSVSQLFCSVLCWFRRSFTS